MERKLTKRIQVGPVAVGGGAPVSIQSMLNTRTTDVEGSLAQIRALAAAWGLSVAQKPSAPCLATRFPYGTAITAEGLERVGLCEALLRRLLPGVRRVASLKRRLPPEPALRGEVNLRNAHS